MCTVSWIHEPGGYQLFCNRDEKLTRGKAKPPRNAVRDGVRFLAPVDADFGGTWIATNEFGLSLSLLNGAPGPSFRSRGLLVLDLISLPSIAALVDRVTTLDLSPYAPFALAGVEAQEPAAVVEWNGDRAAFSFPNESHFMLTSSSFDSGRVREKRGEEYSELTSLGCTPELLADFHKGHGETPSAYSICMHRPDAETVSFSWIHASCAATEFTYYDQAPCRRSQATKVRLPRSAARADAG
jgi:hypothetical protein